MYILDQWTEYQCKWLILSAIKKTNGKPYRNKSINYDFLQYFISVFSVIYSIEMLLRHCS